MDRFDREAATLSRLQNPHVVEIYDYGTTSDGTPYMVMELLDGVTLWGVVKRHGPMSLDEVARLLDQIANALTAAHGMGVVHRDIKPQNIFLYADGGEATAKLIDFGIAKETELTHVSGVTKTGTLIGTPHFMSPEQLLRPKSVDTRTDLWSLAVVAYFALSRRFPFDGDTLAALFAKITARELVLLSEQCPHIPATVDAWLDRALTVEPAKRFRTPREMAAAFKRIVSALDPAVAQYRHRRPPPAHPDDDEDTYIAPDPSPPEIPAPTPPPAREAPPPPPDEEPKERLLPYPFALLSDSPAPQPQPSASPTSREDWLMEKRTLIIALVVALLIAILALWVIP